ncbi:hypothetical protein Droror1_Dr00019550 [Drosera rotundifolia]
MCRNRGSRSRDLHLKTSLAVANRPQSTPTRQGEKELEGEGGGSGGRDGGGGIGEMRLRAAATWWENSSEEENEESRCAEKRVLVGALKSQTLNKKNDFIKCLIFEMFDL